MKCSITLLHLRRKPHIDYFVLVATIIGGIYLINLQPGKLFADQSNLIYGGLNFIDYPTFGSGIFSQFLVFLLSIFGLQNPETLNYLVRVFAFLIFLIPSFLLAKKIIKNELMVVIFILLLFTSRFPFIWLSTELFAAGLLIIIIMGITLSWSPILIGVLNGALSLVKPDLPILVLPLLVYYSCIIRNRNKILHLIFSYCLTFILFLIPGIIQNGIGSLTVRRSFLSFGQHYSALVFPHNIGSREASRMMPWNEWEDFVQSSFPGATSLGEVIYLYPRMYLDFVVLSITHGIVKIAGLIKLLFIPILSTLLWKIMTPKVALQEPRIIDFKRIFLLSLVGLFPSIFMSYVHIRYLAKYAPLFLILVVFLTDELRDGIKTDKVKTILYIVSVFTLLATLYSQSIAFYYNWIFLTPTKIFWFPD